MKVEVRAEKGLELKINFNEEVSVQLTEFGRKIYAKHFREYRFPPSRLKKDADGWCTFPLWELMHIFGPVCYHGNNEVPFAKGIVRIKA